MAVNPMFRSLLLRQLRSSLHRVALGAVALVGLDAAMFASASDSWKYVYLAAAGVFALLAIGALVAAARVERKPAVRELLAKPGTIARLVTDPRGSVRVLLASGTELRIGAPPRDLAKLQELLRGHSPNAELVEP